MSEKARGLIVLAASIAAGVALAVLGTPALRNVLGSLDSGKLPAQRAEAMLAAAMVSGDTVAEITLIVLSTATCSACAAPELPALIENAKRTLRRRASDSGIAFGTVGVGLDPTPSEGFKDLGRFGEFDELLVGRGLSSWGGLIFLWRDYPGSLGVPQALVLKRRFASLNGQLLEIGRGQVIARLVGVPEIARWAEQQYPTERG